MTTNDNLRDLIAEASHLLDLAIDRWAPDWHDAQDLVMRIDAALAARDSGEVVLPPRKTREETSLQPHSRGYNQALDDVVALNKAPAKAEPERQRNHEVIALINALGDTLIDDKEASTDE